jgi:hypothetical protein
MMLLFVAVGAGLFLWPSAECSSDRDCGSGYSCSSGECIVAVSEDECSKDSDCSSGYECSSGECVKTVVEEEEPECYFDKDCSTGYECNDNVCEKIVSTLTTSNISKSNATSAYPNYFINSIVVKSISLTSLGYDVNISNDEATSTSVEDTLNCSVTNNMSSSIYSGVEKDSGPESVDSSVRTCLVAINYSELYESLNFKSPMRLAVNATVDYFNDVNETDERDNSKVGFFDLYKENFTTLPTVSCSSDAGCVSFFGPRYVCSSGVCVAGSASSSSVYPNYLINSVFFENITLDTLNLRVNVTNRNDADSSIAQFLLCEATNNVTRSVYNGTVRHDSPEGLGSEVVICNVSINGTDLYSRLLLKKVMRLGVNVTADYYNNIVESNETDNYKSFVMNLFAENFTFTTLPTISCIDDTGCRRLLGIGYECSDSGVCVAASTTECIVDTDCRRGSVCSSGSCVLSHCNDLLDNDGDGWIDYVNQTEITTIVGDGGCTNINDNSECVNSDCGVYVCDTTNDVCYSTCSTGDECASGYECSSGVCVEAEVEIYEELSCNADSDGGDYPISGGYVSAEGYYWGDFCGTDSSLNYLYEGICNNGLFERRVYSSESGVCSDGGISDDIADSSILSSSGGYVIGSPSALTCNAGVDDPFSMKSLHLYLNGQFSASSVDDACAKNDQDSSDHYSYLLEAVCESGSIYQKVYECTHGCQEGVCCVDSTCGNVEGYACNNYIDDDYDGNIDYYGVCISGIAVSSCKDLFEINGFNYNNISLGSVEWNENCEYYCDELNFYPPDSGCESETDESEVGDVTGETEPAMGCSVQNPCDKGYVCSSGSCVLSECNDGVDNDGDTLFDFYGACLKNGAYSSCQEIGVDVSGETSYGGGIAVYCDQFCVNELNGVYIKKDPQCVSLNDNIERSVVIPSSAAELEDSWVMKVIMFFIKSEPVLEKFKNLGSILL